MQHARLSPVPKTMDENVLVVTRNLFDEVGAFQGLENNPHPYLSKFLKREHNRFLPRSKAENDPSFKQLIPYAVFTCGGKILHYVRGSAGGEQRLVKMGSIGIGGHINDSDESLFSFDEEAYHRAVRREIGEELRIEGGWEERIVALINDDSTEVGRVHLGIVHLVTLETPRVRAAEKAITGLEFLSLQDLAPKIGALETWSQIILGGWGDLAGG
jgi:predicted NUDIX family phosphoesterase